MPAAADANAVAYFRGIVNFECLNLYNAGEMPPAGVSGCGSRHELCIFSLCIFSLPQHLCQDAGMPGCRMMAVGSGPPLQVVILIFGNHIEIHMYSA